MNVTGYFFLIWGFDAMISGRLRLGWLVVAVDLVDTHAARPPRSATRSNR